MITIFLFLYNTGKKLARTIMEINFLKCGKQSENSQRTETTDKFPEVRSGELVVRERLELDGVDCSR